MKYIQKISLNINSRRRTLMAKTRNFLYTNYPDFLFNFSNKIYKIYDHNVNKLNFFVKNKEKKDKSEGNNC